MLTKSRMYKSKSRAVKKAAAVKTACVRWSKTRRYETPYGVTGAIQHTGLKGNLSAVAKEWGYRNVESSRRGAIAGREALRRKTVSPLTGGAV